MSKFFINRPIVAMVISIVMVIIGAITILTLPVALFPNIVPPEVQVLATYVGADAGTIEQSVATPIEQQMSGVDNMNYMYSLNSTADGGMRLIVDYDVKTDPNTDLILTQMRSTQAQSQLPADVNNFGLTVQKTVTAPLMLITLYSPNGTYDARFLANYAYINLADQITRSYGIGSVQIFGAGQYAMRLWVKPDQLAKLAITVPEIVTAIQSQNTVNPAGQVGSEPAPKGQEYTYSVRARGRRTSAEDFGQIVVRETPDGGIVRVKDVARVELGAQNYSVVGRLNGKPGAIIAVYQLPGSNAVEAANGVRKLFADVKTRLPSDMDYVLSLDTTRAVTQGMKEIVLTLVIAIILVIIVVYIFLQGWRATLIPLLAVPVSLVGTFMFFPLFGFSVNTLSLFGLVLAIGLVVDDAIVVVEAVERHIEEGLAPGAAAIKAMDEISGPVVGIALVLSAVFIPTAFVSGITGRLYQQFAVTIAISVILSAFNALTLSPALATLLLKPRTESKGPLARFFGGFNRWFARATRGYVDLSDRLIRKTALSLLILAGCSALAAGLGSRLPTGFIPEEDQGYLVLNVQLPDAASLQRTTEVTEKIEKLMARTKGVHLTTTINGFSLLTRTSASYTAFFFLSLYPWDERRSPGLSAKAILASLNRTLRSEVPEAIAFAFAPPAIPGIGTAGGFSFWLQDRSGGSVELLNDSLQKFLEAARKRPELANVNSAFRADVPQVYADVDHDKVLKQGVAVADVYQTLQAFLGGIYVNQFNRFGRQWRLFLQAEAADRVAPEDIGRFFVRNNDGNMLPLSTVVATRHILGPEYTQRFNLFRSAQITGQPAPGYSSGQAMAALEEVAKRVLPQEIGYDWADLSYQERRAAGRAGAVFALSLGFVFLVLAALYESWSLPFSVLLSVPIAVVGAFLGLFLRGFALDVYGQIGLVMLVGLAAKNAILIVEFAKNAFERGEPLVDAALQGARLRLRPILMTSFAFLLGCVPLWIARGAGAAGRRILGTTVISGMLAATGIAIFLIPVLFVAVQRLSGAERRHARPPDAASAPAEA